MRTESCRPRAPGSSQSYGMQCFVTCFEEADNQRRKGRYSLTARGEGVILGETKSYAFSAKPNQGTGGGFKAASDGVSLEGPTLRVVPSGHSRGGNDLPWHLPTPLSQDEAGTGPALDEVAADTPDAPKIPGQAPGVVSPPALIRSCPHRATRRGRPVRTLPPCPPSRRSRSVPPAG